VNNFAVGHFGVFFQATECRARRATQAVAGERVSTTVVLCATLGTHACKRRFAGGLTGFFGLGCGGVASRRFSAAALRRAVSESEYFSWFLDTGSSDDKPDHVNAIGMISIENANLELVLAALMSAAPMMPRRVAHTIYFTPRAATVRIEILIAAARAELSPNPKTEPDSTSSKLKSATRSKKSTNWRNAA
jgi:hypothetical protein